MTERESGKVGERERERGRKENARGTAGEGGRPLVGETVEHGAGEPTRAAEAERERRDACSGEGFKYKDTEACAVLSY